MNRIYKVDITPDYILRTTFFNGEVRELSIEKELRSNSSYLHLLKYKHLLSSISVNKSRTAVALQDGPSFTYDNIYHEALLTDIVYIDDINIQLAARIQSMRESKRMTQKDMEASTGIHQAEISKIERGIGNPSVATLSKLASAAGHRMTISFEDRGIRKDIPEIARIAPYLKSGKFQGEYVISDLEKIPDDLFYELLEGCIYERNTPSVVHQSILSHILFEITSYIKDKKGTCTVLPAPTGLIFENDERNFLIPDLMIICDEKKIHSDVIEGAADFVLEIASPSNSRRDYGIKQKLYMENGVREYWIINPMKKNLVKYSYEKSDCPEIHNFDEIVGIDIYHNDLKIDFHEINKILQKFQ